MQDKLLSWLWHIPRHSSHWYLYLSTILNKNFWFGFKLMWSQAESECRLYDVNSQRSASKAQYHVCLSFPLTWSSLSNPGALQYRPSPAQGDEGSAPPLKSSHRDRTFPRSPFSATHNPAGGAKGSEAEPEPAPGPIPCLLGLEAASCADSGSGGLEGGGELGVGKGGSSGTKGSRGGLKKMQS